MRWLIAALALCMGLSSYAAPIPYTSVISAGMWLIKDQKRVYQIDVESGGRTFDEARAEGFRVAVEQAVGSLLLSESEVSNRELKRRDIVVYASGYVEKFEILSRDENANGVKLQMRVLVSHSQIADRLLSKSDTKGAIDGNRAVAQLSTISHERATGDRAMALVLNDFPKRAFDVEIGNTNFMYTPSRAAVLEIPFTIKWNYNYVASLNEVLQKASQNPDAVFCRSNCPHQRYIRIESPRSGSRFLSLFGYDDLQRFDLVGAELIGSEPKILVMLRLNSGEVAHRQCYSMPALDHVVNFEVPTSYMVEAVQNLLRINGNKTLQSKVTVAMPSNLQNVNDLSQVEMQIVRFDQCN